LTRWLYPLAAGIAPLWWGLGSLAVSRSEGWGQWAAASLLVLPLGYSLLVGLAGIALCIRAGRGGQPLYRDVAFTLVAFLPWLLVLLRKG